MKEPAKSSQDDTFFQQDSEQKVNILSTPVDDNESKKLSPLKKLWAAYSLFYDRIKKVLILLWIIAFVGLILPHFGAFLIARSQMIHQELPASREHSEIIFDEFKNIKLVSASQMLDQSSIESNQIQINTELLNILDLAYREAEARAIKKLDSYVELLTYRVDDGFLEWYFNFFNQKWREDSALITWISGGSIKEHQEKKFLAEFSERVVSKSEAERKIKLIIDDVAETYVRVLKHRLDRIKFKYDVPQNQWNDYLDSMTLNIPGAENITLAEITAVGVYPLVKVIAVPSLKAVRILGAKGFTALAGAKYAAKLGIKGASETAIGTFAKVADPLVLVGFILWEVGDHYATVPEQKSALHDSFVETFEEIKDDILYSGDSGIINTLYYIENSIRNSIISSSNSVPKSGRESKSYGIADEITPTPLLKV